MSTSPPHPSSHQPSPHQPSSHQPSSHQPSPHQPSSHQPSSHQPSSHQPSASGVVGIEGRYPAHQHAPTPLVLGGRRLLTVGPLRMYTCGITPYDVTHVGHAATFVRADLVATLAHVTGTGTLVARNVTDIDDVLTEAAHERGRPYDELALTQEFHFERDMRALGVATPTLIPRARGHIGAVIRLAAALLASGDAYEREGFVYFRGSGVPAAAGWENDAALAASREYGDQTGVPGRDSELDVAVWRPSPPEHPAWPSPWGWGRPGWHAECAAMAVATLGTTVDVLLGGEDLAFPHHAYQAAMVEAATGARPFARAVLHIGEVRRDGVKMAKSGGNLVLVSELLQRHPGPVVRLALLDRPWKEPWDCTEDVFVAAGDRLAALEAAAAGPAVGEHPPAERHDGVVARLVSELDVSGAVDLALDDPAASAYVLDVLKLRR